MTGTNENDDEMFYLKFHKAINGKEYENVYGSGVKKSIYKEPGILKLYLEVKYSKENDPKAIAEIQKIAAMLNDPKSSDFTCIVGDRSFKVHKAVLAAASPVFDRMFSTPMIEAQTNEAKIDAIDPNIFEHLLRFIYAGKLPENFSEIVVAVDLFKAAHYYEIEDLREICEEKIEDKLSEENAIQFYELAFVYDVQNLKKNIWYFVKR
jgi:hypothetical protein